MKLLRVGAPGRENPAVRAEDGRILDISELTADVDGAFLAGDGVARVRAALEAGTLPELPNGRELRIGAPVARPGKVVCIGLNYRDHAEETGAKIPERPVVFLKASYTVVGPNDTVLIPRGSTKTDYEVELAIVIGREARYLESPEAALEHVAGYAISNDVSEREFQIEYSNQWDLGKSCETFNPLGPWLVTPDEVGDAGKLGLRLSVNGERRQPDLRRRIRGLVPEPVHAARAGRRDQHRHPGRRRAGPAGQAVPARGRRGGAGDRRARHVPAGIRGRVGLK
jgi:2-keto-4-pentenoate hydratase/2-oxohepta-3-ene-1,7-dioic acid hydratase in catechol pathway